MAPESTRTFLRESSVSPPPPACVPSIMDAYRSSPAVQNPTTHGVLQSIVKGRRSWKASRGGELVWPPKLEAALLKGLQSYQPDDSRETRLLGRFPMRNRFISDYIFSTTGKRRTAKQVGSRLQQLKAPNTSNRRLLMGLISPLGEFGPASRRRGSRRPTSSGYDSESTSDTTSRPTTPTDAATNIQNDDYELKTQTIIHIDLLPDAPLSLSSSSFGQSPAFDDCLHSKTARESRQPRPLHSIDPTVTFVSRSPIAARSCFTVESAGVPVYTETTPLEPAGPAPDNADGALLYSTRLVPGWWDKILESSDPTQYTILQEVVHNSPISSPAFSTVYKFRYPSGSPPSRHHTHSRPMSRDSDTGAPIKHEPQDSFSYLFPLVGPFHDMGSERVEPHQDCLSTTIEPIWGGHYSPPQLSITTNLPSVYDRPLSDCILYDDSDLSPSPVSASFPTESMNYGFHSMDIPTHPHDYLHRGL